MATENATILGRFWLNGSNDLQQRIDNPSQAGIQRVAEQLWQPQNLDLWNQFSNFIVNRIALNISRQMRWENPLREFEKQKIWFGSGITETQLNLIKCHTYDVDAETQFKTYYPDGMQAFHTVNSQRQYPISVSREQLRMAFTSETGLNEYAASIMTLPETSNNYDKWNIMLGLLSTADEKYGLARVKVSAAPTDEATCKELLQKLQQLSYDLTVPTTQYALAPLPVYIKREEMVVLIRSDVQAATNVQALAAVFNLDKAEIPYRVKVIPRQSWPLGDGDYCVLTSSDFFQVYQTEYSTTSQWDPVGLKTSYFLNEWNCFSFSPFIPVVCLSLNESAAVPTVTLAPTSLELAAASQTASPGDVIQLTPTLNGTITPDGYHDPVEVAPDAALFDIACTRDVSSEQDGSEIEAVQLNTKTYVDRLFKLHVQKSNLKKGDKLKITAVSTYRNPGGETTPLTASLEITIE